MIKLKFEDEIINQVRQLESEDKILIGYSQRTKVETIGVKDEMVNWVELEVQTET